jgi:predicted transposase YbfD/YdcC
MSRTGVCQRMASCMKASDACQVLVLKSMAWIGFAGAAQIAQVCRTVTGKGKKTAGVVYLITSDRGAGPAAPAAWVRGHWETGNRLDWVRDVTYQEDKSLVRTGNAPRVMASLRSLAISLLRLDGQAGIAAANRHHARDPQRTLKLPQTA